MTHERSTFGSLARSTYCATCAFVSITPRGSIITALADIGRREPLRAEHRMLTRARRVCSFTIANDRGGNGYGFPMRLTSKLSDFVAFTEGGAGCLIGADFTSLLGFILGEEVVATAGSTGVVRTAPDDVLIMPIVPTSSCRGGSSPTGCGLVRIKNAPAIIPTAPTVERDDLVCGDIYRIYAVSSRDSSTRIDVLIISDRIL